MMLSANGLRRSSIRIATALAMLVLSWTIPGAVQNARAQAGACAASGSIPQLINAGCSVTFPCPPPADGVLTNRTGGSCGANALQIGDVIDVVERFTNTSTTDTGGTPVAVSAKLVNTCRDPSLQTTQIQCVVDLDCVTALGACSICIAAITNTLACTSDLCTTEEAGTLTFVAGADAGCLSRAAGVDRCEVDPIDANKVNIFATAAGVTLAPDATNVAVATFRAQATNAVGPPGPCSSASNSFRNVPRSGPPGLLTDDTQCDPQQSGSASGSTARVF